MSNSTSLKWRHSALPEDYEIVPLNPSLAAYVPILEEALACDPDIVPDPDRKDFYAIESRLGGFYVHWYRSRIYLVHYAHPAARTASRDHSRNPLSGGRGLLSVAAS